MKTDTMNLNAKLFNALVVEERDNGVFQMTIKKKQVKDLPRGDVLIRVRYSSLNYKDALSATGNRGVTKAYPHTPGIDAAGEVVKSEDPRFVTGDKVIVTGNDLGMNTCGGFEQYIRVPADWVVKLPETLSMREAMVYGTAGFTAAQCVLEVTREVRPEDGDVVVTGATGGVGSISVALLARLGYTVFAATGKSAEHRFLKKIGASEIIGRDAFLASGNRPLLPGRWAGAVDTVGGETLAGVIRGVKPFGVVSCCGNAGGNDLPLTVFPFILRGVRLVGVSSQNCPMERRLDIWKRLAGEWRLDMLNELCEETGLDGLEHHIDVILRAAQRGRVVVNVDA